MNPSPAMKDFKLTAALTEGRLLFRFEGRLEARNARILWEECVPWIERHPGVPVRAELSGVEYLDGAALAVLLAIENRVRNAGADLILEHAPPRTAALLDLVDREALIEAALPTRSRRVSLVERLGAAGIRLYRDLSFQVSFVGELALVMLHSLRHPFRIRWKDTINHMERVGVDALPIVALIAFLVGLVMGFQGSMSLRQYGVGVLLAQLIALVMVEEMGPLLTAILVAGRSGSAFASEIGTMKVSEELDALTTMGMAPLAFVVIPKLIATAVVMPFLTLFADLVGIVGGMIVGVTMLNVSFGGYMRETVSILEISHLVHGSAKSVIFAFLITVIGCMRGFQTEGGAEGVGRQTTSAVVSGIFLVVLANALYRIVLQSWSM